MYAGTWTDLAQLDSAQNIWTHAFTNLGMFSVILFCSNTVVPGFSVLGFRALPGFRALCTGNQIWIYVINLPGFSALPGFKAPFHGDGQSALNPGTTVSLFHVRNSPETVVSL